MTTTTPAHQDQAWWADDAETVMAEFRTSREGLDSEEASSRLAEFGRNELAAEPSRPPWLIFGAQFANTMIVVLLIAAAVTVAIGDIKDAVVISAIVVLNAAIGFVQEYRAEQVMAALRTMAAPDARVIRGGNRSHNPLD